MSIGHLLWMLAIAGTFAALCGWIESCVQAYRTEVHNYRKLNHAHLTIFRALVLIGPAVHFGGWSFTGVVCLAFMSMAFAPVHRAVKNATSHVRTTYMGPTIRGPRDSAYDTLWMSLAAYRVETWPDVKTGATHTRYHLHHPARPFILCTIFESAVVVALGYLLTTF